MDYFVDFLYNFYTYTKEILPYFLVALLVVSLLEAYTSLSWLKKLTSKEKVAPIYTGILGGLLPLCSCSMIPVANLINSNSKSYAPVVSFLIVAPVISPVTLILTYGLFGLKMTLFRLFATFTFALIMAYLVGYLFKKPKSLPMFSTEKEKSSGKPRIFLSTFRKEALSVGKYLIMGIVVASAIKTFIPPSLVSPFAGTPFSYPLLSLVAVPIYVCSGEEVPIAKALTQIGLTQGNALTFMLGGTGTCLPTLFAVLKFLPKGLVVLYLTGWFIFSSISGLVYDIILYN